MDYLEFLYSGKGNVSRIYKVCKAFYRAEKETKSLTIYFMDFKRTYEELSMLLPFSTDVKVQQIQREQMAVMSFLAGLPPEFKMSKSQILSSSEIPFLQDVFSRVLRIENTSPIQQIMFLLPKEGKITIQEGPTIGEEETRLLITVTMIQAASCATTVMNQATPSHTYQESLKESTLITALAESGKTWLGGLGQFGIITRARIALERAPQRARWIRVLYSNFSSFTQDQEYLISLHGQPDTQKFDYVEGFVIVDEGIINNWRSSFFSSSNPLKVSSFNADGGVLYCLEIAKNYQESNAVSIDQEVEDLLKKLNFIPGSIFTTDLPYVDFLDRVHKAELKLRSKGLWDVPHPWLNLFVPKSRISDFDQGVFKGILGKKTSGPILIYPMNKNKWNNKSSAVTPDEDVFYLVAFLRSALDDGIEIQTLEYLMNQNHQILRYCDDEKINIKQYLPHYTSEQEWIHHFGNKWAQFSKRKMEFDPKYILATGQSIFKPSFNPKKASRR
ncbi:cytokinin dehydrogenase 5-like [Olea europaea var. sylvestris]|uniref:cytokinin dehydrogenase 5-like n=1 Tax=Olea europaea var. sylvestris TaxID=158386 RepID=UPI000C1CCF46|nr:cytokinin dehydrogenase 5-like [Olea europaea var. sylvestris]